jgi:hypothetical protein
MIHYATFLVRDRQPLTFVLTALIFSLLLPSLRPREPLSRQPKSPDSTCARPHRDGLHQKSRSTCAPSGKVPLRHSRAVAAVTNPSTED